MFEKLVEKAKYGDKDSMEEIIMRLQPLIISSIRRYYYKKNEFEDLIQEGNLKIIDSIKAFDNTKNVPFLGYVKSNLKYLYLNKHKERVHLSLNQPISQGEGEILDLLMSPDKNPLELLLDEEISLELAKVLNSLSKRQREIIIYYYVKKLNMKDIASILGISYRTVVNIKTVAVNNLRKKIYSSW